MSAKGRGAKRNPADHYPTPRPAFEPLMKYLPPVPIFEPAAGDYRLVRWMREAGMKCTGKDLIRDGFDFLKSRKRHQCICTNPPFSLALEFCDHAISLADDVFMLLRLNFLASETRRDWWVENEPQKLFVLSKRPSFAIFIQCAGCGHKWSVPSDKGKPKKCPKCTYWSLKFTTSDACDYAWFYWGERKFGTNKGIIHI